MNTAIDYQYIDSHDHDQYEFAVVRAQQLFLDGWRVSIGFSGKDSSAACVCIVEGLRRAKAIRGDVGPLHVVTTNTTLDNMVLHDYMLTLHDDLIEYGRQHDLPIECHELKPALSSLPVVEFVGRGKLLRTPETSSNGRDCALDWKIKPMKTFLKSLSKKYQTDKICSISGSRDDESNVRKGNLKKRGETAHTPVMTDLGWTLALIKEWSLSDVWHLFELIDNDNIESFSDNLWLMKKHYSASNGGACDLFAGKLAANKSCGNRFGCVLCAQVNEDNSLLNKINIDPVQYGFMRPLNDLRTYMVNTLYDFSKRSTLGRKLTKDGYIKVGLNHYSLEYRMDLLRYILTIQQDTYESGGNHTIDLIDYRELLAIQFAWSREGGEEAPGMALQIWHDIVNNGQRYPIPKTTLVEKSFTPTYTYFPLMKFVESNQPVGLDDEGIQAVGKFKEIERMFNRNGEKHRVIRYTESSSFNVVTKNAFAMTFVEDFYLELLEDGHLENKCPTVMLKQLLESGVVTLAKGTIGRVHDDARRAQALNSLRATTGIPTAEAIMALSVSEKVMNAEISSRQTNQATQQSLF
jgi:DNA sulfur modification protein DndC